MSSSLVRTRSRGELEGGGPAWKLGGVAQAIAKRQVVQLHDDAVGLERQVAALVGPAAAELDDGVNPFAALMVRLDRQPPCAHRLEQREMGWPGIGTPGATTWYVYAPSRRRLTSRGSRFRIVPAAALRGFMKERLALGVALEVDAGE